MKAGPWIDKAILKRACRDQFANLVSFDGMRPVAVEISGYNARILFERPKRDPATVTEFAPYQMYIWDGED